MPFSVENQQQKYGFFCVPRKSAYAFGSKSGICLSQPPAESVCKAMNLDKLKHRARRLRAETYALYLAGKHPQVPWYAKLVIFITVAYALSPIDLIPDFIPVIGYLDDLVIVPLGITLALKMVPAGIMANCRQQAEVAFQTRKPISRTGAIIVMAIWALAAWWLGGVLYKLLR